MKQLNYLQFNSKAILCLFVVINYQTYTIYIIDIIIYLGLINSNISLTLP